MYRCFLSTRQLVHLDLNPAVSSGIMLVLMLNCWRRSYVKKHVCKKKHNRQYQVQQK